MPPAVDLSYLADAGPEEMADCVASYEHLLFSSRVPLDNPMLVLMVFDPHHREASLKPVMLPYQPGDIARFGGAPGRGQVSRFVASLAVGMRDSPPDRIREITPFYTPGQRLLYAALATESVSVQPVPDYIPNLLLDVPTEQQHHVRALYACDGRGYLYALQRPDGQEGPPSLAIAVCRADPSAPARYLHDETHDVNSVSHRSLLPWALDVLACAYRRVFEPETEKEETSCGSSAKAKKKAHSRRKGARRRR